MLTYATLQQRPRLIRSLTGLSAGQFQTLLGRFVPAWQDAEGQRLNRPGRRRKAGAGRPYKLTDADKLLLFLTLCRHGLTYELAGLLFALDTSNACKLFKRLAGVVEAAADPQLATALADAVKMREELGGTLGDFHDLLAQFPELLEVAIDSTEQARWRPGSKRVRKRCYSGKAKDYTLKTTIVVSNVPGHRQRVLYVSAGYDGPTPDNAIYQAEGLGDLIPPRTRQYLDLGYQGLPHLYPKHDLRLPHKRRSPGCRGKGQKGPPLTRGQKQANGRRKRKRVVVENALAPIRSYRLLDHRWRSRDQHHNGVFRAVAALCNFRLAA